MELGDLIKDSLSRKHYAIASLLRNSKCKGYKVQPIYYTNRVEEYWTVGPEDDVEPQACYYMFSVTPVKMGFDVNTRLYSERPISGRV